MDYLKLFENHSEYEAFVSGGTMVRPNVSHFVNENEVHYNPIAIMTVRYNVTDASNPTQLYFYMLQEGITVNGALMFDKVVIDGAEVSIADLDTAQGTYQFATEGEHTVKYTLKDPTFIGTEVDEEGMPTTTKIGAVFMECTSIVSVNIPNSVTSIDTAFGNCSNLTSVTIPDSVTSIEGAFGNCSNLTNITIPNSVTTIGQYAFTASGLISVTLGNGVTTIGQTAFATCYALTSITIPDSVTTIDYEAFTDCSSLTSVTVKALTPPTLKGGAFDYNASGRKIYVPSESVNAYKTANGWSAYANDIEPIQ